MRRRLLLNFSMLTTIFSGSSLAQSEVLDVCERTSAVQTFIVDRINLDQQTQKTCADITTEDLESLLRIAVDGQNISEFKVGDFSGLPNLEILNIRSNPYKTLPEGLFAGLDNLQTLVIIATSLRYYPDDFLADIPNLRQCYCFRNEVRSISLSVLERLTNLTDLNELEFDGSLQSAEKEYIERAFSERDDFSLFFH